MCKVRDYKATDFEATINLMKMLSNLIGTPFNEENWKHIAKQRAFNPQYRTLIAEVEGNIAGMCFADIHRDESGLIHGLIRNVVVDPQFRGKGAASELIRTAIDIFRELEVHNIRVQVLEQMKDAFSIIHLFEKFNFKRNAIVMEKDVLKIREYMDTDYEDTKELMQLYSDLINIPFNEAEWKHTLKIRVRNPQYRILISESSDKITGMAFINIATDETGLVIGYLENIIVHPDFRAQGFGKALLMRAIEILNVMNVDKIRVMAHLEVKNYLKIFEDVGFHMAASIMELRLQ